MINPNLIIRNAEIRDIDKIIDFIRLNWAQNHILVNERGFFNYQHLINNKITFVVAEDPTSKELYGICGYISSNNTSNKTNWGAIFKVIKTGYPALGINLLKFIINLSDCSIFAGCGINAKTAPIYDFMGYKTGKLDHYYRIDDRDEYKIAVINNKKIIPSSNNHYKLLRLYSFNDFRNHFDIDKYKNRKPCKDNWYILRRFYNHPVYTYHIYGIEDKGEIKSVLVGREINQNGSIILRLVDFIGIDEDLKGISAEIQRLIDDNNYEYIDFYSHGINEDHLNKAGFVKRTEEDSNIIPNYFEPFEQKNIDIFFFTTDDNNFYMFKGDGDQDRPNHI